MCGRVYIPLHPRYKIDGGHSLGVKTMLHPRQIKRKGYQGEVRALKILEGFYDYVVRVPMSLLPFDILCISLQRGEIVFVEVKSGRSDLSPRQEHFKNIIESRNDWKVKYEVLRL